MNVVSPGTIYIEDGSRDGVERDNPEFFAGALASNPLGVYGALTRGMQY